MKSVLVTGSRGFLGKNLVVALSRRKDVTIYCHDIGDDLADFKVAIEKADVIYHFAGANRPKDETDFEKHNVDFTKELLRSIERSSKKSKLIFASTVQAEMDNPYGTSKLRAEAAIREYGRKTGCLIYIYRLKNIFGKWAKPAYNSVIATFCYNISHNLDIRIDDRSKKIDFIYIDDVITEFLRHLDGENLVACSEILSVEPFYTISLGELADLIYDFSRIKKTLLVPDFSNDFVKRLYATYLSYLDSSELICSLDTKKDERGILAEIIKSRNAGQVFISKTKPGIRRGGHYHDTKVEKFCVINGEALIELKCINKGELICYKVSGNELQIVNIPPGYVHSIQNVGDTELITLFWAGDVFNPERPDTFKYEV